MLQLITYNYNCSHRLPYILGRGLLIGLLDSMIRAKPYMSDKSQATNLFQIHCQCFNFHLIVFDFTWYQLISLISIGLSYRLEKLILFFHMVWFNVIWCDMTWFDSVCMYAVWVRWLIWMWIKSNLYMICFVGDYRDKSNSIILIMIYFATRATEIFHMHWAV